MKTTISRAARLFSFAATGAVLFFGGHFGFAGTNYIALPPGGANQDGSNGADDFHSIMRIQECYGGSLFPQQPIVIRELRFRPSAAVGFAFSTTISNIQINLSTSSSQPEALNANFASNLGPDKTTVFNGALPMSSAFTGPAAGPKDFDMVVPFTTPFTFDPTKGNLIIEIINRSGSSAATYIDGWGAHNDQCGRAWAYGVDPTNATYIDWGVEDVQIFYDAPARTSGQFDLSRDYATNANPAGPWSYGWKSNLTASLNLFTRHGFEPQPDGGLWDYWLKPSGGPAAIFHNAGTTTITNNGGQGIYPPGTLFLDPGIEGSADNFSVARLTIPPAGGGQYQMDVAFHTHVDGSLSGDSDFHILQNGSEIYARQVAPSSGGSVSQTVTVYAGDTIDFVVGRGADGRESGSGLKLQATLTLVGTNAPPSTATYDLSSDFSTTANPNGVWTYGYKSTLSGQLSILPRFIRLADPLTPNVPFDLWVPTSGGYPGVYHNGTTLTGHSDGGQGTYPPGVVWFYPGDDRSTNNFGVIRFTVPSSGAGNYRLISAVHSSLDGPSSGDTDFHVLVNGAETFGQFLSGNSGGGYSNNLALAAGDTVDFAVGRGADGHLSGATGLKIQATLSLLTTNSPAPCAEVGAGLVGWWPGEGNANDVLGANNGVALSGVTYAAGRVGQGFNFNGTSSSYVVVSNSPALNLSNAVTVEFWFLSRRWSPGGFGAFSKRAPSGVCNYGLNISQPYGLGVYYNDLTVSGAGDLGSDFEISTYFPLPSTNVFHHLACTYNQADSNHVHLETYLDGLMVTNKTILGNLARTVNTAPLIIGSTAGVVEYFDGIIDEFSLYNRVLSAAEIKSIFKASAKGKRKLAIALCHRSEESHQFGFNLNGEEGANYEVEASEDLVHWTRLTGITNCPGSISISDPDSGQFTHRFYRARVIE